METDHLALALAVTVRHDGHGGVADDLAEPAGLTRWVRQHTDELREFGFTASPGAAVAGPASGGTAASVPGSTPRPAVSSTSGAARSLLAADQLPPAADAFVADAASLAAALDVRTATRALFARAVSPGAPSKADAGRLPDAGTALARLNAAGARVPVAHRLDWPADGTPTAGYAAAGEHTRADLLAAALARAAVAFLAGPDRVRLRACPAPRCVRYFVQAHARQEWCKPSCGNRARVARHHARRREEAAQHPSRSGARHSWTADRLGPNGVNATGRTGATVDAARTRRCPTRSGARPRNSAPRACGGWRASAPSSRTWSAACRSP